MLKNKINLSHVIINEESSDTVTYHNKLIETIYYNTLPILRKAPWKSIKDDIFIVYNKYGFRSPEFVPNVDYLFSGCSVTFGNGLNIEDIWHEKLIKNLGGSYASIAMHGDSIPAQVLKIFAYIKEFGAPKNIVALFPDFDRFLIYNNKNLIASQTFFNSYNKDTEDWALSGGNDDRTNQYLYSMSKNTAPIDQYQSKKDFFKRPLVANEVITQEISHMYSSHYIHMLSDYCSSNNIKFVWSTWDEQSENIINKVKNNIFFTEYISMQASDWKFNQDLVFDVLKDQNCHLELIHKKDFHLANDRYLGIEHAHYGIHRHIHYYEIFLNYIKEKWLNDKIR
jgi:hypothetical protein